MARKANTLTVLQEISGQAQLTNRQPAVELATLYMMQMRARSLKVAPPRRRLKVLANPMARAEISQPVKIIHIDLV